MTKPTIVKLFIGGVVAVVAGIIAAVFGGLSAFASGGFVMSGPDVVGFNPTAYLWVFVGVAVIGAFAIIGGFAAGLVAWIGALINTSYLEDKAWFTLLLVLGLLSFGFIAMIAYAIAGPDGTLLRARPPVERMNVGAGA
jgi:hypothetical protein